MFKKSLIAALILTTTSTTVQADISEWTFNLLNNRNVTFAAASGNKHQVYKRPSASFKGQWFTTQNGCSYSRANPPGGKPVWYLIQNPHHLGQPKAHSGCARTL
jgi:hypothetical protein